MIHVFVINTIKVEPNFGAKLRSRLKERDDIKSFVFNTSRAGMEKEIVERMIHFYEGERFRFYCCGGSGTLRNMIEGARNYEQAEFAFCPFGKTNDFLKVFGKDISEFKDIDRLIEGHVEKIDYIKSEYACALNTVSYGIDTVLTKSLYDTKEYNIFGKAIPDILSYIKAVFGTKPVKLIYSVDGHYKSDGISELILGNGVAIGGAMYYNDNPDVMDSYADYFVASGVRTLGMIKIIRYMLKNDVAGVKNNTINGKFASFTLKSADDEALALNVDGEIVRGGSEWHFEVVPRGLNFVLPKGL
ncbi:MAG: hypothetical protein MJ107_07480 [Lachnospiraceae bacterium]|nr:hypothetical protein [Lachnospiraceae bacterium]